MEAELPATAAGRAEVDNFLKEVRILLAQPLDRERGATPQRSRWQIAALRSKIKHCAEVDIPDRKLVMLRADSVLRQAAKSTDPDQLHGWYAEMLAMLEAAAARYAKVKGHEFGSIQSKTPNLLGLLDKIGSLSDQLERGHALRGAKTAKGLDVTKAPMLKLKDALVNNEMKIAVTEQTKASETDVNEVPVTDVMKVEKLMTLEELIKKDDVCGPLRDLLGALERQRAAMSLRPGAFSRYNLDQVGVSRSLRGKCTIL